MASTTIRRTSSVHAPVRTDRFRLLGTLAALLGIGAAAVSLLGPLVAGIIEYHVSDGALDQVAGGDAAALLLVAPTSLAAGILALRRHRAAPAMALGPSVYSLYMYSQLALGNDIGRHPGNSEQFFPLFLALVVLAGAITVIALVELRAAELPPIRSSIARGLGAFLLVVAFFLTFGLHLPGLIDALGATTPSSEYAADPVVFWLVKMMDLGFVVPALVWAGVSLLKQRPTAHLLAFAGVGWTALLGSSVAGMAVVMQLKGDPAASTVNTMAFGSFAAIAVGFAITTYRTLFDNR